jgi:thymidylate synthase
VQVEKEDDKKIINLLAVYRNHDFYERAYGNYLGLIKLIQYIANETNSEVGNLTCISSHAELNGKNKKRLIEIAERIIGDYDAI